MHQGQDVLREGQVLRAKAMWERVSAIGMDVQVYAKKIKISSCDLKSHVCSGGQCLRKCEKESDCPSCQACAPIVGKGKKGLACKARREKNEKAIIFFVFMCENRRCATPSASRPRCA